jgi:predicted dehydrogenase
MSRPTLRTAIVGAGLMGRWHGHAVARAGGRVAAVVDSDERAAVALARRHRGASAGTRLDEALRAVDVVHVCTPAGTHPDVAEQAIAAGCHVLVEKPLADDAAETSRLLALADASGVLLCPVHQFVFQRGVQAAVRKRGALAPILHVQITICSAGAATLDPAARDRVAWEVLPHALSLLVRLDPGEWTDWRVLKPGTGELRVMGVAARRGQRELGTSAGIIVSMAGRPPRNELLVIGAGGAVEVDLFHGFSVFEPPQVSRWRKASRPFVRAARGLLGAGGNLARRAIEREMAYPGLTELVHRFQAAAAGLGPPPVSAAETLAVARQLDAIREALDGV